MNKSILVLTLCIIMASCGTTKQILYFQDAKLNTPEKIEDSLEITILPKDMISIVVSSKDPQLAALFNLPIISYQAGKTDLRSSYNNQISGYTVDPEGNIDFPVLGSLKVGGLTRKQLSETVKEHLIAEKLINDPVVTVDFMNLHVSVLGEVAKPGKYNIDRDQISLLEAISQAGDLTIYGRRDGVFVIREEAGKRTTYKVDLRSSDLFTSPVYYLKQNDIVYVEPNKVRAGQSTVNDNNLKSISLWMSLASLLTTLGVLIFK